jgi:L-malate glycosyltransferase
MYPSRRNPVFGIFVKEAALGLETRGVTVVKTIRRFAGTPGGKIFEYALFYLRCIRDGLVRPYDLIFVHFVTRSLFPAVLFKGLRKVPLVINFHGTDLHARGFWKAVNKAAVSMADLIIVPSDSFGALLRERFPSAAGKIFVSPSGGIPGYFKRVSNSDPPSRKSVLSIGYVSGIRYEKGWSFFLEALSFLDSIPFNAVMIGSGPDTEAAAAAIAEKKLPVELIPVMPRKDLAKRYSSFDVMVFPSLRESLGLVGLEAMACGVPVIGSRIDGICDYLQDGYNGFAVPPGDAGGIAGALRDFAALPSSSREEFRKAAEETAGAYRDDVVTDALYNRFKTLAGLS